MATMLSPSQWTNQLHLHKIWDEKTSTYPNFNDSLAPANKVMTSKNNYTSQKQKAMKWNNLISEELYQERW